MKTLRELSGLEEYYIVSFLEYGTENKADNEQPSKRFAKRSDVIAHILNEFIEKYEETYVDGNTHIDVLFIDYWSEYARIVHDSEGSIVKGFSRSTVLEAVRDDAYDRFEALVGEYEAQRKADAENDSDYYAGRL